MAKMTGGRAVTRGLIANGVEVIFALPGIQMDHFFNALHDEGNSIRVFHTRHEQATAYMANGYAAASGRPGVYAVVPGPGVLNTTAALSTAYAAGFPVLALSGQNPLGTLGRDCGMLHEIPDQLAILRGLTKWAERIEHPTEAGGKVASAFAEMASGRERPVALEIPADILAAEAEVAEPVVGAPAPRPPLDMAAIEAAADMLAAAKSPMICVGRGGYADRDALRQIAEMLQAPTMSHRAGRGALDDRHYLAQTVLTAPDHWAEADVILGVASRMQQQRMQWRLRPGQKVILIDIDPKAMHRIGRPDLAVQAHTGDALPALAQAIAARKPERASRETELRAHRDAKLAELRAALPVQMAYLQVLRDALGEDDILVEELTQVCYLARAAYPVYKPGTLINSGYQGTLGAGYATALGAKVAAPDRRVLSVNGDGGFMYNVQEIATAVQHNLAVVAVVFNDGAYGNVRRMQKNQHGGRVIATDLQNPDFVALAASFGAEAERVDSPEALAAALERGFASGRPYLIDVEMGELPDPFPFISPQPKG